MLLAQTEHNLQLAAYKQIKPANLNFPFENGFEDTREMLLTLLRIAESKEKGFSVLLTETIEFNQRSKSASGSDSKFLFGPKCFVVPSDIPKIREVAIKQGLYQAFVNNSGKNEYRKSSSTYHELFIKEDSNKKPMGALMLMTCFDKVSGYEIEATYVGDVEFGLILKQELDEYTHKRKYLPTISTARNIQDYGDGPFVTFKDELLDMAAETSFSSFYPDIKESIEQLALDYLNSNAPVMLLYGPTGTGKTTLIRTIAKELKAVMVTTSDLRIASSPALFDTYKEIIKKALEDGDPRPHILVIEDVDSLLMQRIKGNRDMSRFLNETKGLGSNKHIKVIFTTNLTELDDIDTALLRPGRCFKKINCRKLTIEEAEKVRTDLQYDKIDLNKFATDGLISLAEAIEELKVLDEVNKEVDKVFAASKPFINSLY